jgi:hypothetical protein
MADKPIRCDECGFVIGSITQTAHGSPQETLTGSNSNCKHPPIEACSSARTARIKARSSLKRSETQ